MSNTIKVGAFNVLSQGVSNCGTGLEIYTMVSGKENGGDKIFKALNTLLYLTIKLEQSDLLDDTPVWVPDWPEAAKIVYDFFSKGEDEVITELRNTWLSGEFFFDKKKLPPNEAEIVINLKTKFSEALQKMNEYAEDAEDADLKIIYDKIFKQINTLPYGKGLAEIMKKLHGEVLDLSLYGGFEIGSNEPEKLNKVKGTKEFQTQYFDAKRRFIEREIRTFFQGTAQGILVCTEFDYPIVTTASKPEPCPGKTLPQNTVGRKILACDEEELTVKIEHNTYVPHLVTAGETHTRAGNPAIYGNECIELPQDLKYIRVGNKMNKTAKFVTSSMAELELDAKIQKITEETQKKINKLKEYYNIREDGDNPNDDIFVNDVAQLKDADGKQKKKAKTDATEKDGSLITGTGKKFNNMFNGPLNKILQASHGSPMLNSNGNLGRVIIYKGFEIPIPMLDNYEFIVSSEEEDLAIKEAVKNLIGVKTSLVVDLLLFEYQQLVIVAVHLDSTTQLSLIKETESEYLLEIVKALENKGYNVIVSGDFNFPMEVLNDRSVVEGFIMEYDPKAQPPNNYDHNNHWNKLLDSLNLNSNDINVGVGVALKKRFHDKLGNDQLWEKKLDKRAYNTDGVGCGQKTMTKFIAGAMDQQYEPRVDQSNYYHPYIHFDGETINWKRSHLSDHILVYRIFTLKILAKLGGGARKLKRSKNRRKKGSKKSKKNRRNRK
jgi:hypothetical protein